MILCIGPNSGMDRVMVVPGLRLGEVFRAEHILPMASGKGINVARAVIRLGGDGLAAGMLGGHTGRWMAELADVEGVPGVWTWIAGESRSNIILVDPQIGQATVINELGPVIAPDEWARFHADLVAAAQRPDCDGICVSGSLPPSVPAGKFAALVADLSTLGKPTWVDTSGAALDAALHVADGRFGFKINGFEAGQLLGMAVEDVAAAHEAAKRLHALRIPAVAITLGKQGAVYSDAHGAWFAASGPIQPVSPIGSGDSFMAALAQRLIAAPDDPAEALRHAVAAGAANALSIGSGIFTREEFDQLLPTSRVERVE
ncbi:MAG: hexose kinase [Anaerolineae bacterium]|nr:hexose kinase [Anaerolineae bacterium]